jgi:hypothetical protein
MAAHESVNVTLFHISANEEDEENTDSRTRDVGLLVQGKP